MAKQANSEGYHHPFRENAERGGSGSSGGPPGGPSKGPKGPTVHNGWTAEPARRGENDARIESFRNAHRSPQLGPIVK